MKKRCIAALLALLLLAGCASAAPGEDRGQNPQGEADSRQEAGEEFSIRIAFNKNDSLNPYLAFSQANRLASSLLFDPLIKLTPEYEAQPYLAQSVQNNGSVLTVSLRADARFSDGSSLTAADVVYSFEQARASSLYQSQLSPFTSCAAAEDGTVVFQLASADRLAENLLTFPIVKSGSLLTGSGVAKGVEGTGRYRLRQEEGEYTLTANESHFSGSPLVNEIHLVSITDDSALAYSVDVGLIDYLFLDLSSTEEYSIGSANVPVAMNNLVYLGMNANRTFFQDARFRRAIGAAIDYSDLLQRAYSGHAQEAKTVLNPAFHELSDLSLENRRDTAAAAALLDELGYLDRDGEGYRMSNGRRITLNLVVNEENAARVTIAQRMKEYLSSAGIDVKVETLDYESYRLRILRGEYDLYVGEVKLEDNFDLTPFFSGSGFSASMDISPELLAAYQGFRTGTGSTQGLVEAFEEELPFVPLAYRSGMVAFSRDFPAEVTATEQDVFYRIQPRGEEVSASQEQR